MSTLLLAFITLGFKGIIGSLIAFIIAVILLALALYVIRECAAALGWPIPPPFFKLLTLLALVIAIGYAIAIFAGYSVAP